MTTPVEAAYVADLAALRERLERDALPAVKRELTRQQREVVRRASQGATGRGKAAGGLRGEEAKAVLTLWAPSQLVPDWHAARLRRALSNVYLRALRESHGLATARFNLRSRLTAEDTRAYVAQAGQRLVGVADTTRQAVALALREGLLARDTPERLAVRLRGLPEFDEARARTVAATELAHATNWAAQTAYERDPRVRGVVIHDRERCAPEGGPCAGWNGRRLTIPEAGAIPLTFHPSCSQSRTPAFTQDAGGG